jgi:DNA polymerase-3 subunit gamma/tau
LLVLSVDPARITDADIAPEGDRDRLQALLPRYSREDLLRAFDVLTRAEIDIRNAAEPRYHLEMALLRWIHLRKLTPLTTLMEQMRGASAPARPIAAASFPSAIPKPAVPGRIVPPPTPMRPAPASSAVVAKRVATSQPARPAVPTAAPVPRPTPPTAVPDRFPAVAPPDGPGGTTPSTGDLKTAFLAEAQRERPGTFGTVVAQATAVDVVGDRLVITVSSKFLIEQVTQAKGWLESVAQRVAGRRITVVGQVSGAGPSGHAEGATVSGRDAGHVQAKGDLIAAAQAHPSVQTLLEIVPAEITDVSELKEP